MFERPTRWPALPTCSPAHSGSSRTTCRNDSESSLGTGWWCCTAAASSGRRVSGRSRTRTSPYGCAARVLEGCDPSPVVCTPGAGAAIPSKRLMPVRHQSTSKRAISPVDRCATGLLRLRGVELAPALRVDLPLHHLAAAWRHEVQAVVAFLRPL